MSPVVIQRQENDGENFIKNTFINVRKSPFVGSSELTEEYEYTRINLYSAFCDSISVRHFIMYCRSRH